MDGRTKSLQILSFMEFVYAHMGSISVMLIYISCGKYYQVPGRAIVCPFSHMIASGINKMVSFWNLLDLYTIYHLDLNMLQDFNHTINSIH